MLNGISKKGLNTFNKVTIENFLSVRSNAILQNLDQLLKENPDDLIIHVVTNDLTKKTFCSQKNIWLIDNKNTNESYLGKKNLHLSNKCKAFFTKN